MFTDLADGTDVLMQDTRSEPSQSVPKPKGLANIGHSCYVSCILQLLHASPVPAIFLNCGLGHLLNTVDGVSSTKLKVLQQLVWSADKHVLSHVF